MAHASLTPKQVEAAVRQEVARQDASYGAFDSSIGGMRLAVACLQDEASECFDAWQNWKRRPDWHQLRGEAVQLAAVAHRLARDVEVELVD
jgi:hypothetical protein